MRTLQEIMGHADYKTTMIYAGYAPNAQEVAMVDRAFADELKSGGEVRGAVLSEPDRAKSTQGHVNAG